MIKQDKYAIRCAKCNTVFGSLAHLELYKKRICNNCCPTSKFDSKGLFEGCECKKIELKNNFDASKAVVSILKIAKEGFE